MNQLQKALELGEINCWTVLKEGDRKGFAVCECVCGYVGEVKLQGLFDGKSKSCGCIQRALRRESRKDGFINDVDCTTKEYKAIRDHWNGMIYRVMNTSRHPTYNGVSICENWRKLSNFIEWASTFEKVEGMHLDKDLIAGNRLVYSPETCCFVPPKVNLAISIKKRKGKPRDLPIGVIKRVQNSKVKYIAQCNVGDKGKPLWIGSFDDPLEAHIAWMKAKKGYLSRLLDESFCEKTKRGLLRIMRKLDKYISSEEIIENFD